MGRSKLTAVIFAAVLTLTVMAGCGAKGDTAIASIGDTRIPFGLANFMCRYYQIEQDRLYADFFGRPDWSLDLYGSGTTLEEGARSAVMEELHELYTLAEEAHMASYGVLLSGTDLEEIRAEAKALLAAYTEETLDEMGAESVYVEEMLRLRLIRSRMRQAILAEAELIVPEDMTESDQAVWIAERQDELYEEVLSEWQEGDGWQVNEKLLSSIRFRSGRILDPDIADSKDR